MSGGAAVADASLSNVSYLSTDYINVKHFVRFYVYQFKLQRTYSTIDAYVLYSSRV